jgi:hypothetical protein
MFFSTPKSETYTSFANVVSYGRHGLGQKVYDAFYRNERDNRPTFTDIQGWNYATRSFLEQTVNGEELIAAYAELPESLIASHIEAFRRRESQVNNSIERTPIGTSNESDREIIFKEMVGGFTTLANNMANYSLALWVYSKKPRQVVNDAKVITNLLSSTHISVLKYLENIHTTSHPEYITIVDALINGLPLTYNLPNDDQLYEIPRRQFSQTPGVDLSKYLAVVTKELHIVLRDQDLLPEEKRGCPFRRAHLNIKRFGIKSPLATNGVHAFVNLTGRSLHRTLKNMQ